jgi:intracellular multiplication protein IcmL
VGIEGYTDPPAQSNQAFGAGPVEWPAQKVYQSPKPSPAPSSDFEAPNDLQAGQVPLKSPLASKAPQSLPSSSGQLAKSSLEPWPLDSSEPHLPLKGAVEAGKENKKRLTASKLPRSEPPRPEPSGDREEDLKIPPHGTEVVIESRNWYLGQNEKLFKVLTITAAVLLISLGLNAYFSIFRPQPKYFAVTRDLRVLEMPPLSEPVVGNQALINWAADAVTGSLSLNFLSWRRTLSESRENFDREGFDSFLEALKSGGHLEKIEQERLSLSCVIAGAPVVTQSGLKNAVMTWKLEMPLALSYESSSGVVASQKLLAEVEVKRTDTVNNPRGVVIRQMILSKSS